MIRAELIAAELLQIDRGKSAELATLRARVVELEGVLRGALSAIECVLAWRMMLEDTHKAGMRAEDSKHAWTDARSAIAAIRAALEGAKP